MASIIIPGPPFCPLCGKRMREIWTRDQCYFVCTQIDCMVSIAKNDPCIKHWRTVSPIKCQLCAKPMKMFFRSDGFCKMVCRDRSHNPNSIMRGDPKYMGPV